MKKTCNILFPFLSGLLNGLFASGGGIPAVMFLKSKGLSQKSAQATALCITFLMSLVSVTVYAFKGYFSLGDALVYIPFGIPGALVGSALLKRIPDSLLRKLFALFIIWAGTRMIF